MKNIKVELLHATPLWIAAQAIRRSKGTEDKSDSIPTSIFSNNQSFNIGSKDRDLIHRVGCKFKHESVLELVWFAFDVDDISRALLQEWSRTRIGFSQTVRSSRYTLQELKEEDSFVGIDCILPNQRKQAEKYICMTKDIEINSYNIQALDNLRIALKNGVSNDVAKYTLPEAFRTSLTCSFNLRALRHMLQLRTAKSALAEYRHLAHLIYNAIPEEYHYLLEDCIIEPDPLENQSC